VIGR